MIETERSPEAGELRIAGQRNRLRPGKEAEPCGHDEDFDS